MKAARGHCGAEFAAPILLPCRPQPWPARPSCAGFVSGGGRIPLHPPCSFPRWPWRPQRGVEARPWRRIPLLLPRFATAAAGPLSLSPAGGLGGQDGPGGRRVRLGFDAPRTSIVPLPSSCRGGGDRGSQAPGAVAGSSSRTLAAVAGPEHTRARGVRVLGERWRVGRRSAAQLVGGRSSSLTNQARGAVRCLVCRRALLTGRKKQRRDKGESQRKGSQIVFGC